LREQSQPVLTRPQLPVPQHLPGQPTNKPMHSQRQRIFGRTVWISPIIPLALHTPLGPNATLSMERFQMCLQTNVGGGQRWRDGKQALHYLL